MPFDDCLAVKAHELDAHDGVGHHLLHCVQWSGNDGGNETVLETVNGRLDGFGHIPWG